MSAAIDPRPLIAHVVYRFDIGGLENGVVNLINHLPVEAYRHVVIALTEVTDFRQRITRPDVECIALDKPPGQTFKLYPRLYRLFRELRPAIVHTRNLAALECTVPAWAAGVPVRIHGEHGREGSDLDGSSRKYRWIRRAYRPFVSRYIALSQELAGYLRDSVGVEAQRLERIYNGVDAEKFEVIEIVREYYDLQLILYVEDENVLCFPNARNLPPNDHALSLVPLRLVELDEEIPVPRWRRERIEVPPHALSLLPRLGCCFHQ